MNFKTKGIIAILILLFISGTAFLAGFIQESFAAPANKMKAEAADLHINSGINNCNCLINNRSNISINPKLDWSVKTKKEPF